MLAPVGIAAGTVTLSVLVPEGLMLLKRPMLPGRLVLVLPEKLTSVLPGLGKLTSVLPGWLELSD
jgi:hypothetical protein